MYRSKRKRNIIIFSLIGVLLCMVVGYAAFQTQLKVTGTSKVTSNWDIEITNVTAGTPSGSAENTVAPSCDKLWASMEADLYDKGDAMEYDVTIENKGTLDAKLNDIITNMQNSNSDAVIITFSGYTKGEILKSGNTKVVHVKIEYNPEYEGGETSSEVKINFDYTQNNNEENNPDSQYLLTYDYSTNGGNGVERTEEYFGSGSKVDLSNKATKEGWTFVGWNTDKDAETGLKSYQMPVGNTTLYAIYSKALKVTYEQGENITSIGKTNDSCNIYNNQTSCEVTLPEITATDGYISDGWYSGEEKIGDSNEKYTIKEDTTLTSKAIEDIIELSISTTSTTNSITVVANATSPSGIVKYEYSKDGGNNWIEGTSNTYTFTGLTSSTSYNIMVRVTNNSGKITSSNKETSTSTLAKPTFSSTNNGEVVINYPSGCTNGKTCSYSKNNGAYSNVSTSSTIYFGTDGNVVARVTDGTNTVTSTFNVIRNDLYISSSGNDSTGYGTKNKPYATLAKAYTSATSTASSTINVMSNITQSSTASFNKSKTVTVTSYGSVRTITKGSSSISLISLSSGNVTLKNIIFDGNNSQNSYAGITISNGATMTMGANTTIKNCYATYMGGAIKVSNGGILNISGATITNNKSWQRGGAIYVDNGTLNINSGTISNNKSIANDNADGGAILGQNKAQVNIKGGTITGNSGRNGFAIMVLGDGSKLTMTNGSITKNSGQTGAVSVWNGASFVMSGGSITNNTGTWRVGGIGFSKGTNGGTYSRTGGTISGNVPADTYIE